MFCSFQVLVLIFFYADHKIIFFHEKRITCICSYFVYHSYFTEAYRRECLATAVKLLEKICKGFKITSYNQNYSDIPVACMSLVASIADIVYCKKQQVCEVNDMDSLSAFETELTCVNLRHIHNTNTVLILNKKKTCLGPSGRGQRAKIWKRLGLSGNGHYERLD